MNISTKENPQNHGYGHIIIKEMIERLNGESNIKIENKCFKYGIILNKEKIL